MKKFSMPALKHQLKRHDGKLLTDSMTNEILLSFKVRHDLSEYVSSVDFTQKTQYDIYLDMNKILRGDMVFVRY